MLRSCFTVHFAESTCRVESRRANHPFSRHQSPDIYRGVLVFGFAFVFAVDRESSHPVKVIVGILAGTVDQQILLFVDQVLPLVLAHLEIGSELDGIGGTRLLTKSTKDTPRKVDAKKSGIAPTIFILCRLKSDTIHGTCDRTKIAGHASLLAVGIA
jgi:hypothetical protein